MTLRQDCNNQISCVKCVILAQYLVSSASNVRSLIRQHKEACNFTLYFQYKGFQLVIIAANVDSHEAGNNLSDHAPVGVATDQIVVIKRIKWQIVNQVLHAGIKAVMARFVTVQFDVRNVMCAKRSRHTRLHTGPDHVNVISVKFHITAFNVDDPPVLPAVPLVDPLVVPDAHGTVKEQRSADEVYTIEDHASVCVTNFL